MPKRQLFGDSSSIIIFIIIILWSVHHGLGGLNDSSLSSSIITFIIVILWSVHLHHGLGPMGHNE